MIPPSAQATAEAAFKAAERFSVVPNNYPHHDDPAKHEASSERILIQRPIFVNKKPE
jgi:hypothetical protein